MSMTYWGIIGQGVCFDDIDNYLNHQKVNDLVRKMNPKEIFEEDVFEDNTFFGEPYSSFGEFVCELDDDGIFTWDTDGDYSGNFLYKPLYPWECNKNEPKSYDEMVDKMIAVLKKIYDAPYNYLKMKIDDINTVGIG